MSNGFKTDTDVLRQAGAGFTKQHDALSAALATLRSGLPDVVGMCGGDEQGRKFAAQYRPYADKLQQVLGDMTTGLGWASGGRRATPASAGRAPPSTARWLRPWTRSTAAARPA